MTNTKWLRQALLGSVALGVMATGAQANELSELKAQLEGLQSRVNQLEQQPAQASMPEGASFITFSRGSAEFPNYGTQAARDLHQMPSDRGFTIAVTPTADLPAPIAEVVIYGFVKGDVIYDFNGIDDHTFNVMGLWSRDTKGRHVRAHAFQSRFGIRSRTDTAIGQIRTTIEGDFLGSPFGDFGEYRLRHAYGEWDMTPNWTLLVGQTTRTAVLTTLGVPLVDLGGSAGPNGFPRAAQVRMTYHSGPVSWAVAIEAPTHTSAAKWPNLSSYLKFDAPGGHEFMVTGTVADQRDSAFHTVSGDDIGWAVQAGANINLADIATLTVGGIYGRGQHCQYYAQAFCGGRDANKFGGSWGPLRDDDTRSFGGGNDFFSDEGWGVLAGLSFGLTDTTTLNVQYGLNHLENDRDFPWSADSLQVQTLHANIMWQPVQQMRLGWEIMWGQYRFDNGTFNEPWMTCEDSDGLTRCPKRKDDGIRAQFGAWFFF